MLPVARARRALFARHCNPWSAWTRWASTPLTLAPAWTRRWSHAVLLAVWLAVNPFIFGKPVHHGAWSTRAMLGEELWISRRPRDAGHVRQRADIGGLARRRRLGPPASTRTGGHGDRGGGDHDIGGVGGDRAPV